MNLALILRILATIASLPSFVAIVLVIIAKLSYEITHHFQITSHNILFEPARLGIYAFILCLLGLITNPVAIVLTLVASILGIKSSEKKVLWVITMSGLMSWLLSGWLLRYW